MSNAINELSKLNFEGKEWICELRNNICNSGNYTDTDIEEAFSKLHSDTKIKESTMSEETKDEEPNFKTLWRLYDNRNVAGLYNNKTIEFSPNLTVIYGKNGSGKSSYYKVLKDAFLSPQNIIGNIYTSSKETITAKMDFVDKKNHILYQRKGNPQNILGTDILTIDWESKKQFRSKIKFCDKEILASSLTKKDVGWNINRYKLNYYDTFRSAIEKVEAKVNDKTSLLTDQVKAAIKIMVNGLKSDNPDSIKVFLSNERNISEIETKLTEIIKLVPDEDSTTKKAIYQKESTYSVADLKTEIELIDNRTRSHEIVIKYLLEKTSILENFSAILAKSNRLTQLKNGLDLSSFNQYKLLFNPVANGDKYFELIKKIAETALIFGFENYPETIDTCFYCNQTLPADKKSLILQIHEIVGNEINTEIIELKEHIRQYVKKIGDIKIENQNTVITEVGDLYSTITQQPISYKKTIDTAIEKGTIELIKKNLENEYRGIIDIKEDLTNTQTILFICRSEIACLQNKKDDLSEKLISIEKIKKDANISLKKIEDDEFLFQQKDTITEILSIIKNRKKYEATSKLFQGYKSKISKDKGRVEEDLLRKDYLTKFNTNLDFFELSKRENIKRPFSNPGGKSKIEGKIEANGQSFGINDILSEGEAKIYSLCDWLTELEFDTNSILIFDDPITSLDQVNIAKLVDKIVMLSQNYQTVVFTHNFEFYHRLIQKTLGGKALHSAKCEFCESNTEKEQCIGLVPNTDRIHKCCAYYQVEHILQPGELKKEVLFLSLEWESRLKILRKNLLSGNIAEADKHLRTTINNFFEKFVLNEIKRQVYKNNDLIKEWRGIRDIDPADYDALMEVHNKVSSEGTIHEPSPEVRTTMSVQDYIREFNKAVDAINNIRSFRNQTPPQLIPRIDNIAETKN